MKTVRLTMVTALLLSVSASFSQTKNEKEQEKKDTVKKQPDNFMDLASKSLTGLFGENFEGNSNGITKGIGFLELLEKAEFSEKEKQEYRNWYFLQAKDMTQAQKDSLGTALYRKIIEEQHKTNGQ